MNQQSPWLEDLNRSRPVQKLESDISTDVLIIGGGIAGISTAYFVLTHTKLNVVLAEATQVGHGATGHNAGQMVAYFETPLHHLAKIHGAQKVIRAKEDVVSGWKLVKEIYKKAHLKTPCRIFKGVTGFTTSSGVLNRLEELHLQKDAHIPQEPMLVASDSSLALRIPDTYRPLCRLVPKATIKKLLHSKSDDFIAANLSRRGVLNSARFSEEVATYLVKTFPARFSLYEQTPVSTLLLKRNITQSSANNRTISASYTVLCTNGYEYLKIKNIHGRQIPSLTKRIIQTVGFMAGYTYESLNRTPHIHIYRDVTHQGKNDYYYLTKRSHLGRQLVTLGGGYELVLKNKSYEPQSSYSYPQKAEDNLKSFLAQYYMPFASHARPFTYKWHGVMGYTQNGLRLIGKEPRNSRLLYNLGCNGTGILHSLFGAKKISKLLSGSRYRASIFDPT